MLGLYIIKVFNAYIESTAPSLYCQLLDLKLVFQLKVNIESSIVSNNWADWASVLHLHKL